MDDELIEFKEVTKRFGKNTVLNGINLSIPEGKITGIIGASGEGKSTILKMIVSFYKPTKGKIYYRKTSAIKNKKIISKIFGLAIEDGSFYEKLTVEENLFHFGRLYKIKRKELRKRREELLSLMGLTKARKTMAENLSIGMKKRLDIACALIHNPSVLILDEPTADLDPLLRKQMLQLIKNINAHGTTVIITTQLLSEAEELCEKVAILFNEEIIIQDSPKNIKQKYNSKTLDEVFQKIFSNKERTTYQESSTKKTKLKLSKKKEVIKKSLITDISKLDEAIESLTEKEDSDYLIKKLNKGK